ncbi:MAG: hypothetical protein ACLQVF_20165, partial [Isosphaeraceae bacterium]
MAESAVFYLRAPTAEIPPPHFVVKGAKVVLGESEETLKRIAAELLAVSGYLSDAGRKAILLRALGDENRAAQFESLLNLGDVFVRDRGGIDGLLSVLEGWQTGTDNQKQPTLSPNELSELKRLLPLIVMPYPARQRQAKAARLAIATGLRAETVDLVCDIRPVFDDSRTKVEGVIPFTTLKVVAFGVDRFPVYF